MPCNLSGYFDPEMAARFAGETVQQLQYLDYPSPLKTMKLILASTAPTRAPLPLLSSDSYGSGRL